ncbi:fimbria/pilus outer membrane usher protein [Stenotrophomonas sp. TEPEL]|uniref:fimbria/pilus outer membrane usher protein n=1 Tax=Stenotrophomonas sp. TEPEL TaxID=2283801 RepID=UPI001F103400|nr:fimbria/pilus outer membrane usher protein [Stenotrophomonas sp. TEPEL]
MLNPVHASDTEHLEFSAGFLIGGKSIDLQRYVQGNPMEPGVYPLDVVVNGQFLDKRDITFVAAPSAHGATACLPAGLVRQLALKDAYMEALDGDDASCVALPTLVEGATVEFDSGSLQLLVNIPQAAQARNARGYVAPDQRDHGITAAFFDYNVNHNRSQGHNSTYLGLNTGLNLGAWRLRHRSSFSQTSYGSRHDVISSTLQRDLPAWNAQLLLGQGNTGGELFESLSFTGVRVASDERMLPDSLRGFAPVVQGIAEGNAVVTIRQNGNVIHEVSVAPGPFSIEDLYPTNFGGDLDVTVTEADGRQQNFKVNFSAVPQALRPGASRFSATAGELRDARGVRESLRFAEGTYARGISNHFTALGGMQVAEDFQSALFGGAINTPLGAFGADVTHSRARLANGEQITGNSFRLNYQRYVASTGTNFGLAALRYSTRGYLSLNDFAQARADDWGYSSRARQRFQVNFSQRIGERSTLSLSGGHVRYWDGAAPQNDLQLRFQSSIGRANYSLSAVRYRQGDGRQDTRYSATLSIPLGKAPSAPRLSAQLAQSARGEQGQLGLNGTLGKDQQLSYSLAASDASDGASSASAYASYRGGHGTVTAGYSRSGDYNAFNASAAGSVVLHRDGINFGAPVGDGFALVQADGAQGARIGYGNEVRIGRNGYALLPHVSPYRWNQIELDPSGLSMDVELLQTSQRVAPTAGSIVRVAFNATRERTLFIDATDALGQPLPFAARIEDETGRSYGAVGQGGVIQLRGAPEQGQLIVDPDGPQRCRLEYTTPAAPDAYGLSWSQAVCTPLPPPSPGLQAALTAVDATSL